MPIAGAGVVVAARPPRSGLRLGEWLNREGVLGPLFVAPALLLLLVLVAYPFCMALYFSMSDAFIGRPSQFIGSCAVMDLTDGFPVTILIFPIRRH